MLDVTELGSSLRIEIPILSQERELSHLLLQDVSSSSVGVVSLSQAAVKAESATSVESQEVLQDEMGGDETTQQDGGIPERQQSGGEEQPSPRQQEPVAGTSQQGDLLLRPQVVALAGEDLRHVCSVTTQTDLHLHEDDIIMVIPRTGRHMSVKFE